MRHVILVLCLALGTGCSGPLLTMTDRDAAAVLQPVSRSNVVDARANFRQVFCAVNDDHGGTLPDYRDCDSALHRLADEPLPNLPGVEFGFSNDLHIFVVPGIFGECIIDQVSPFSFALEHMRSHGIEFSVLTGIHGRASSELNARVIHDYFSDVDKPEDRKLIVLAYSKGTTDMLYYLSNDAYASSYGKIDALVSVAGVVNGSPLADDTNSLAKAIAKDFPYDDCPTQDESGIDDLTRKRQFLRLSEQTIPEHISLYSMVAYAKLGDISSVFSDSWKRLSRVDPRNDGQVIYYDSVMPGAHLLGYANADHWAVALPFARQESLSGLIIKSVAHSVDKNAYPREVLIEAIIRYVDRDL